MKIQKNTNTCASVAWISGGFCHNVAEKQSLGKFCLDKFDALLKASGEGRELSTTMAIVRIANMMLKDKQVGKMWCQSFLTNPVLWYGRYVPFRRHLNQQGQNYVPETMTNRCSRKESKTGQVLQEGINESGAMSDWIAAATALLQCMANHSVLHLLLMFGMQRVLDLCWAAR